MRCNANLAHFQSVPYGEKEQAALEQWLKDGRGCVEEENIDVVATISADVDQAESTTPRSSSFSGSVSDGVSGSIDGSSSSSGKPQRRRRGVPLWQDRDFDIRKDLGDLPGEWV
jgi:hypothetical protein